MRRYIARLMDAGMPRDVALSVCRHYMKYFGRQALEVYVEAVEDENGEMATL